MKKVLALVLAISMLFAFGMFAFANEDIDPILGQVEEDVDPNSVYQPSGAGFVDSLFSSLNGFEMEGFSDLLGVFSGFDLTNFTDIFSGLSGNLGMELPDIFGGGDMVAGFMDALNSVLGMVGIDVNGMMEDSMIFGFFSQLYTGIYTGGGTGTTDPTDPPPTDPPLPPTDDNPPPEPPPDTGVPETAIFVAAGALLVALAAAVLLRRKKAAEV
ncbi:MAG: LPXTG cell wall anchor domain-containing protein [Oscillospiraceae bacterium]|nr:LPXTG cell wall anchor domain-containing protein [Oscillospiraceae bacterium]